MTARGRGAVSLARDTAARHPEAMLPCPLCAAAVKGANLERHLGSVHPERRESDDDKGLTWTGPERLILRPLVLIALLSVVGVIAWSWRSGRELRPWFLAETVVVLAVLVLAGLAVADVRLFLGRLSVSGDRVRLRHTLFLCTRTLRAVDRVDVGSAYRLVSDSTVSASVDLSVGGASHAERAGAYLRLYDGRRSITVHCRNNTGLRRTWTGWRQAKRRRRWDLTLRPADFVALQYALAAAGLLRLRES